MGFRYLEDGGDAAEVVESVDGGAGVDKGVAWGEKGGGGSGLTASAVVPSSGHNSCWWSDLVWLW